MVIVLNAGHKPGKDSGCIGVNTVEADLTYKFTNKIIWYMKQLGVKAFFIQHESLQTVCNITNGYNADMFISIHCNSCKDHTGTGTETYYYNNSVNGKKMADYIHHYVSTATKLPDRGVKSSNFYVLKNTKCPAILIELGFIDNPNDERVLVNNMESICKTIAKGIVAYAKENYKDTVVKENTNQVAPNAAIAGLYKSKYFSKSELVCHCGCGFYRPSPILLQFLDDLRERLGKPVYLNCACRCPRHNAAVGGVRNSQHTGNMVTAADINASGIGVSKLAQLCKELGADGIGEYHNGNFVHADVRNGRKGSNIRWRG